MGSVGEEKRVDVRVHHEVKPGMCSRARDGNRNIIGSFTRVHLGHGKEGDYLSVVDARVALCIGAEDSVLAQESERIRNNIK